MARAIAQAVSVVWRRHRSRVTNDGDVARSARGAERPVHHLLWYGACSPRRAAGVVHLGSSAWRPPYRF